jgi:NADH-ubiquinone oxidoreductase chain 4L
MYYFNSLALFSIGFIGFILNRKHILLALLSIELMILATTLLFLVKAHFSEDVSGLIIGIYAIVLAGAESAIGLALVVSYHKNHGQIQLT